MQVLRILWIAALVSLCRADSKDSQDTKNTQDTMADTKSQTATDTNNDAGTNRTRRSDVLGLFNTKFHKKFALLGSLSSSNPHIPETGPDYGPPLTYDHKAFSLWSFKKAIFSTLLQAIKAITGGVIALKGQIIKVKGHLIAAKGHLLQTKGEAITDFGRHIATKALLTPVHVPPSATGLSAYGHTGTAPGGTGYAASKPLYGLPLPSAVSAPSSGYGAPSKPAYGPPPSVPSSSYGAPPAKVPPSSYGPPPAKVPPSSYGPPPAAPSSSYGGPAAPPSSPPDSSYGAPPPPVPSTSYGTPVGSVPAPSGDYSGPPPPSSSFGVSGPSNNLYLPPSFPSGPGFSAPATAYGSPLKRDIKLPDGVQAGLLVLKPINVPAAGFPGLDPRNNRPPRVRKSPHPLLPLAPAPFL